MSIVVAAFKFLVQDQSWSGMRELWGFRSDSEAATNVKALGKVFHSRFGVMGRAQSVEAWVSASVTFEFGSFLVEVVS